MPVATDDVMTNIDNAGNAMAVLLGQLQLVESSQYFFVTIPANPDATLSGILRFNLDRLATLRYEYEVNSVDGISLVFTGCRMWEVQRYFHERVNTTSLQLPVRVLAEVEQLHTMMETLVLSMLQRALDLGTDVFEEWQECKENEDGLGMFENAPPQSAEEAEEGGACVTRHAYSSQSFLCITH